MEFKKEEILLMQFNLQKIFDAGCLQGDLAREEFWNLTHEDLFAIFCMNEVYLKMKG